MAKNEEEAGELWSQARGTRKFFLKTQRVRASLELSEGPSLPLTPGTCQVGPLHWVSHSFHMPLSHPHNLGHSGAFRKPCLAHAHPVQPHLPQTIFLEHGCNRITPSITKP